MKITAMDFVLNDNYFLYNLLHQRIQNETKSYLNGFVFGYIR